MFFIAITLLGIISYQQLAVQIVPDISFPAMGVWAQYEGSPDEKEEKVTAPLEALAASMPKVKKIRSWTSDWGVWMMVEFEYSVDMRFAVIDFNDKLNLFRKNFPPRTFYANARNFDTSFAKWLFMEVVIKGESDETSLRNIATDKIKQQLEDISGVAEVSVGGNYWSTYDITLNKDKMIQYMVPFNQLLSKISSYTNEDIFIGELKGVNQTYYLKLNTKLDDIDLLKDIKIDDSGTITLGDIAKVEENVNKPEWIYRIDGKNSIGIRIKKEAKVNPIKLKKKVKKRVQEINQSLPPGFEISISEDYTEIIEKIINKVASLAIVGGLLAILVLFLFLRNIKMTLIIATAIPISIIATFNLMYFQNLSLNVISLIGLAIGVGMLVDNSIVVLENIYRHYKQSGDAIQSAKMGSYQVGKALFASTATTVVVFLPILFIEGEIKLIFKEGALAIIFPIIMSLLVSLTLIPMVASKILSHRDKEKSKLNKRLNNLFNYLTKWYPYRYKNSHKTRIISREIYSFILRGSLRHRVRLIIVVTLVILFTYVYMRKNLESGRMNEESAHEDSFNVYVKMPKGTDVEAASDIVKQVEEKLDKLPEKKIMRTWIDKENTNLTIQLKDIKERKRTAKDIKKTIIDEIGPIENAEVTLYPYNPEEMTNIQYGEGGTIDLKGPDYNVQLFLAKVLIDELSYIKGIRKAELETQKGNPEVQVIIDPEKSSLFNISVQSIVADIESTREKGKISSLKYTKNDKDIDIVFKLEGEKNKLLNDIKYMKVFSGFGNEIALQEISTIKFASSVNSIYRENQEKVVHINFFTIPEYKFVEIKNQIIETLNNLRFPAGYIAKLGGEEEKVNEMKKNLKWAVYISLFLIYMLMAATFESYFSPFIIMFTIPLIIIGIIWALYFTNTPFDEMSAFGVLLLPGVVVNNGIVLIDYVHNILRRGKAYSRERAVIIGCYHRVKPILMTTATTVLGLLPLALRTKGENMWSPMAITISGGLLSSTLLTLIIIPATYLTIEDIINFIKRFFAKNFNRIFIWRWILLFWSPKRMRMKKLAIASTVPVTISVPTGVSFDTYIDSYDVKRDSSRIDSSSNVTRDLSRTVETKQCSVPTDLDKEELSIEIRNLCKIYPVFKLKKLGYFIPSTKYKYGARPIEGIEALKKIDLKITRGMFGLLGPNGAGKTTLMQIVAGLMKQTFGAVYINGYNIITQKPSAKRQIGYLPQSFSLYEDFTAYQYLNYFALLSGIKSSKERANTIVRLLGEVDLIDVKNEKIKNFSGGMKKRIAIAKALITIPKVIIVDEPTAGLDPIERVKFRNLLSKLSRERIIILSTHIVEDISVSCNDIAIINKGELLFQGSPQELIIMASGNIYEFIGEEKDIHQLMTHHKVIYRKATLKGILLRFIKKDDYLLNSQQVTPTLEDAYLFLLHNND